MQTQNRTRHTMTRMLASVLTWALVAGQVMQPVYAVLTPLGDVPIAAKVAAKPNIVYTLDDSGSMQFNYLPDFVVSVAANITIGSITRVGLVATASGLGANTISVGDFVTIAGASPAQYNGYFQVVTKPSGTSFTYNMTAIPASSPAGLAAGYANMVVVASGSYCRSGNNTTTCGAQAMNIASTGTAVAITSTTRAPVFPAVGPALATATGTVANFQQISTGDSLLIAGATTTSAPFNGVYTVTKTSPTTFTYTIAAIATTPTVAAGAKTFVLAGGSTFAAPPLHAADFNRLAYNPNVTYTAPLKADGLPLTNTGTDANGNYGTSAALYGNPTVDRDPFSAFETAAGVTPMWAATVKDDLNIKIGVQLYCNTDWPLLVNDPFYPGGPNGATALDAGTTNGQYSPGTGGWCRINGTAYDVSVPSGAPAAVADYNYPWRSSSGAKNAKYFYQQLSVKTLWCDATSPYWPRNGVITGCTSGGTPTGGSSQPQSCFQTGSPNVCTGSWPTLTYKDTATMTTFCDNSATWCSPPGIGTTPECKACTCIPNTPSKAARCNLTATPGLGGSFANCGCTGTGCLLTACANFVTNPTGCSAGVPIYGGPAASASCTSLLWDPAAGVYSGTAPSLMPATSLYADSQGSGVACRHNNQTYAVGGAAGLFKYSGTYLTDVSAANQALGQLGKFITGTTSGCPTVGTVVPIPRHYYVIDSVKFCNDRIVLADDQWKGFGTGVGLACQAKNDLADHKEVTYGKFIRVDLFSGNSVPFSGNANLAASATPFPNGRVWLDPSPTPANSESVNYANWYAYYSTRLNAAKTTSSIGFSFLTAGAGDPDAYRVGFHNLGEEPVGFGGAGKPIIWVDVNDWNLAQRVLWYAQLFGISVSTFKTPTIDAMLRIGNLFETGGAGGLPAAVNPLPALAKDPTSKDASNNLISCQNSYHILFTDGKTNQVSLPNISPPPTDQDATIPPFLTTVPPYPPGNTDTVLPTLSLGGAWPKPFVQGPAVANTLADVATRYWATDLRDGTYGIALKNDVPSESGAGTGDIVIDSNGRAKDVAWWQHVNFSAISFGAEGTLDPSNQGATLASIKSGALSWPNLAQPNNPIYPRGAAAGAVAVDDLWHATLMARGSFVFAKTPVEVSYGIANILAGIQNQRKSRSGAAFNGQVLDANNNVIFEPTIEPGWAGDLLKVQIDPASGSPVLAPPQGIWWQARNTLAAQIDPVLTGVVEPWMDPAHRRVVTLANTLGAGGKIAGPGVPFQYASLFAAPVGPTMLNSLAPAANVKQQQKIIAYLRGGNTFNAGATIIEGTRIGDFRKRFGALGDISNAQPVIVGPPDRGFVNATDPGYTTYISTQAARPTVVVAPANDGMVHVFDAGPMKPVGPGGGTEIFAYIPRALFRGVAGAAATEDVTAIQALTYQDGGVPIYHHHMYVDSSPRAADIDFGNGTGNWHTIVVGGLGKGGNSYYALDLTDVNVPDEGAAASKVLWEWFNPDADVGPGARLIAGGSPGFTYGRPVIVKVRDSAYPFGRWVVIVTAGYNNFSGKGKVYFLDAKTGVLLSTVTTSLGTNIDPAGLAQTHGFVRNQNNQTVEQIYGGDLLGNAWRIDVSATDSYLTAPAVLFAELKDPLNVPQPVTTAPQIEIDINNGIDRYVFFGTGRLLHPDDLTNPPTPQPQTFYAIRDGTLTTIIPPGALLPIQPRVTMVAVATATTAAIPGGAVNGWYQDLPSDPALPLGAQRIVIDPQASVNIAAYVGTKIQDDPCVISLPAYLYARDYTSGSSLLDNGSGGALPWIYYDKGVVGLQLVGRVQPDGSLSLGALTYKETVGGNTPANIINPATGPGIRWSWRLLTGQ